jgi:hypothetical protein
MSALVLVWVPATPNSSRRPETDSFAKSRMQTEQGSNGVKLGDITVPYLERVSRQNGLGNETSIEVRTYIPIERVFIGDSKGEGGCSYDKRRSDGKIGGGAKVSLGVHERFEHLGMET